MLAYEEELFGPVAAVIPVKTEAEAIAVANDPSSAWAAPSSRATSRAARHIAAELIESGCVFVNDRCARTLVCRSAASGERYGRELSSYGYPRVRQRRDGARGLSLRTST
jgi:succinate-semialdehyde dehydrogenase/glutarate-semialdehyde dehydrogenase